MVSKARLDLPEPDSPVNTISLSRGSSTLMFLRLCSRAPRTVMVGWFVRVAILPEPSSEHPFCHAEPARSGPSRRTVRLPGVAHLAAEVVDLVAQARRVLE